MHEPRHDAISTETKKETRTEADEHDSPPAPRRGGLAVRTHLRAGFKVTFYAEQVKLTLSETDA